ncbi:MAG: ROK family protein [Desulfobacteraceae bacterium]|nr:ROK family protein [Desulfobacteraceae bacterium]
MDIFAGIEAGGTKFVCAVGDATGKVHEQITIPTTTPEETMARVIEFYDNINKKKKLSAFGVGSFGPVDPNPNSPTYGYITSTPKPGWTDFDILGTIKKAFNLPTGFDTDVNGAALGEYKWGAAKGLDTFLYVTVGTGIGAGGMAGGKMLHGLIHPEMGHIFIPHDKEKDPFPGVCPYHGDCLEGLATGPSIIKRWGVKSALDLPADHQAWDLEASYLAYMVANYICCLSPQKIIIGGGVMKQKSLLGKIHPRVQKLLNGYINNKAITENIESFLVSPGLDQNAGICGAIALAEKAYQDR